MTRAISACLVALIGMGLVVLSPGCKDEGIGDPCTPEQEFDPSFTGFSEKEVNVESKSFQCRTRICLVNHFRGRQSCPYGQDPDGKSPGGVTGVNKDGCLIPGTTQHVNGEAPRDPMMPDVPIYKDKNKKALVPAQCVDRAADKAVYCSCRCADKDGNKPSDQTFCDCPDGFACTSLVTSTGVGNEGLTGSYCIKDNTAFNKDTACNQGDCDPIAKKCGE